MLLVVQAGVKAEFGGGVLAFLGPARNADHPAAARLGQRRKRTAHGAGGRAHHHGLAGLRLNDLDQTVPGGDARHADRAQVMRQRNMRRVNLAQRAHLLCVDHAELLPATHADDGVARLEFWRAAFKHLAGRAALHDLPERLRCRVALGVVHAAAHVGVQAQKVVAHQHLAVLQGWRFSRDQLEVTGACFANRARVQKDLEIGRHGFFSLVSGGSN